MIDIIEMGVWAMLGIGILTALIVLITHIVAQRSQQHMNETSQANLYNLHSLGIQAIIGANEMKIVDESLQNGKARTQPTQTQTVQGGTKT